MADFASWQQPNLANLAADQQAEIVRLNNQQAATLAVLKGLAVEYAELCDKVCKFPQRNVAYVAAMEDLSK